MTTAIRPNHGKIVRWLGRLSDDQVLELVARIDRQMAETGMAAGPIRLAMIEFAATMPSARSAHPEGIR